MAEDWLADVRKYAADADERVVAAIVRHCGVALRNRDSSLVAMSDKVETDRVREGFLKKKLALTDDDSTLDAAIAAVGAQMREDRTKNRVTVYYLLAEHFGLLGLFGGAAAGGAVAAAAAGGAAGAIEPGTGGGAQAEVPGAADAATSSIDTAAAQSAPLVGGDVVPFEGDAPDAPAADDTAGAAPVVAAVVAGLGAESLGAATSPHAVPVDASGASAGASEDEVAAIVAPDAAEAALTPPVVPAGLVGRAGIADDDSGRRGGMGWLVLLLLALIVLALLFFLVRGCTPTESAKAPVARAPAATPVPAPAATPAPAPAPAAAPQGAAVVPADRDGKPMLSVYFDTGQSRIAADFASQSEALKAYLDQHADARLAVSGFNDPTGNAAVNARLSRERAQAVSRSLQSMGVAATAIDLIRPENATDNSGDHARARRVEVTVR